MKAYDIIVIGSGPGGHTAAIKAAQLGMRVAVVEKERAGGICVNWGCIPTKALVKSAEALFTAKNSVKYGIHISGEAVPVFDQIINRSRTIADNVGKGVLFQFKKNNINLISGHGTVQPDHRVEVNDGITSTIYQAPHIIIATGARSKELPGIPIDGQHVIGYKAALTLDRLPATLTVIGSGAIGSELSYIYNTFGTKVTLIESEETIIPLEDADVARQLERNFKKEGINVLTGAQVVSVETNQGMCRTLVNTKKGSAEILSEKILLATGIKRNIQHIGLEEAGIVTEDDRIQVDDYYRTNVPGYYAIGDAVKGQALAHVASMEATICVEAIAGKSPEKLNYGNVPSCIYCNLEVASVGMTEKQLKERGMAYRVAMYPFAASGKASASGHKDGFVKLIFGPAPGNLCLGAHMIGHNVSELIGEIALARKLNASVADLLNTVHPHPTMSEAIYEAATHLDVTQQHPKT